MKIKFIGAIQAVTGSCSLLTFNVGGQEKYSLIDCGMYQGSEEVDKKNFLDFPFDPTKLDYLFLTHGHIDHSGLIPKLVKSGFKGQILATEATSDLCDLMLRDSARIQESETERYNRNRLRMGKEPKQPLYTEEDAKAALKFFKPVKYRDEIFIYNDISVKFCDAGHVLGSAFLKFSVLEKGQKYNVVFSGDIGNSPVPILKDPDKLEDADYVVIESTYGDRVRSNDANRSLELARVINDTAKAGGKLIIPSFAVGRTQELIYEIHQMRDKNMVAGLPIYIDSPLACSATSIFRKHIECFDKEMMDYLNSQNDPFNFPGISYASSPDESRAINDINTPQIIISASGMANNGRILHHLKYNIFKKECTVLFVGYQGVGTLGRRIADGEKVVSIMGDKYAVNARVETIQGFSAHADQAGLLKWVTNSEKRPRNVFVIHGEEAAKKTLQSKFSELGLPSLVPGAFDEFEITDSRTFRQTADGSVAKPLPFAQPAAGAEKPKDYAFMEKPLTMVAPSSSAMTAISDNVLEKMSKRELIKLFKDFRSQLQSMESKIDNLISKIKK